MEWKSGVGDVEALARSKVLSSRNKIVFLGFRPSSPLSENRHNKKGAHSRSEEGSSPPFKGFFWQRSASINSRGKAVSDSQSRSR